MQIGATESSTLSLETEFSRELVDTEITCNKLKCPKMRFEI